MRPNGFVTFTDGTGRELTDEEYEKQFLNHPEWEKAYYSPELDEILIIGQSKNGLLWIYRMEWTNFEECTGKLHSMWHQPGDPIQVPAETFELGDL